jgi:hypothetical protein
MDFLVTGYFICLYSLQGKADGNKCALWVRWHLQKYMFSIGCFIQLHCGKVLFMGLLMSKYNKACQTSQMDERHYFYVLIDGHVPRVKTHIVLQQYFQYTT